MRHALCTACFSPPSVNCSHRVVLPRVPTVLHCPLRDGAPVFNLHVDAATDVTAKEAHLVRGRHSIGPYAAVLTSYATSPSASGAPTHINCNCPVTATLAFCCP